MRRLWSLGFALLVACSGGPGGIPLTPSSHGVLPDSLRGRHREDRLPIAMQIRIPHHRHRTSDRRHPDTISPSTLSVSVKVNATAPQVFNTTPYSKNCSTKSGSLICAFQILVSGGKNTLLVKTYSAKNAGGFVLDQATAVTRVTSTTKSVGIILGPVISNTNDSGPGSLRQALTEAHPGDTLLYVGTTPGTITLTGGAIALAKNVTISGPGANKLTIDANNASQAFTVGAGVTATISGVTITKGTSSANGGAVGNAGTLTLTDNTISNSTATTAGGAVDNAGVLTSTSNTYSGNTAQNGGAIDNTGTLTAKSDTYSGNNAVGTGTGPDIVKAMRPAREPKHRHLKRPHVRPGGVRHAPQIPKRVFLPSHLRPHPVVPNTPNGGAIYNGVAGTIDVSQSSFSGNGAQQGDGGAISSAGTASGWTIANNTFTNNTAAYGGAVAVDTAGTLNSDTFTSNSGYPGNPLAYPPVLAYGIGGAVYASAALTVTNCTFSGNVAGGGSQAGAYGYGGAIEADNAALTVSGSTFKNNVAGGANSSGSSGQGGAIDTTSLSALAVSITNSTFTGNSAGGGSAGTSFGYGGAIDLETYNTLVINGSTFTSNSAGGDGYGNGGAIEAQADVSGSNDTFSKNSATGTSVSQNISGGAIDSNSTVELSHSTFSQNSATGGNGVIVNGGAIAVTSSALTIDTSTFTGNSASAPGGSSLCGAAIMGRGAMTITNSAFTSNSLTTGAGGFTDGSGVCNFNNAVTISGTTFTSNTGTGGSGSTEDGGGAELDSPSTLTNVTFSQNSVSGTGTGTFAQGGGLYLINGTTITGGTFTNNSATTTVGAGNEAWGGAINGGTFSFTGTVTGNTASHQAGGMYVGSLTMDSSTVSGNTVTAARAAALPTPDGGGAIVNNGTTVITNSTISGNSVAGTGAGGGVLNYNAALTGTNDTIANNTASVDGGGISDLGGTGSTLLHVTLYGNTATTGNGGNWNNSALPSSPGSLTNSIAGAGTAGGTGPDIYNAGTINSGDYNVVQTAPTPTGFASPPPHDQIGISPVLAALANNGGPTLTMADSATSPGYNTIPIVGSSCNGTGVTADQRGNVRPGTGHTNCDAGAFEFP